MELTDIEAMECSIGKVFTEIAKLRKVLDNNTVYFDEALMRELKIL